MTELSIEEKLEDRIKRELPPVVFDRKYKAIIPYQYTEQYPEILTWLNENTTGDVEIKVSPSGTDNDIHLGIFIGFEKSDDALFFRIKFGL